MSPKRSNAWVFFKKTNNTTAKCIVCKQKVKCHGSTNNLMEHLKRKHHQFLSPLQTAQSLETEESEVTDNPSTSAAPSAPVNRGVNSDVAGPSSSTGMTNTNQQQKLPSNKVKQINNLFTLKNNLVNDKYDGIKLAIMTSLRKTSSVALTADMWTSIATEGYISVTAHYVCDGKLKSAVLSTRELPHNRTSEVIAAAVGSIMVD